MLVPQQQTGNKMDAQSENIFTDENEAKSFYSKVKSRLLDINNWDKVCGTSASTFQLTLPNGTETDQFKVGHLIKIDIPGPGTAAGDGYDWVHIEQIEASDDVDLQEWIGFTVRPCHSPIHPQMGIAHFYSDEATSTFIVGRNGKTIWAEMHGRNEVSNADTDQIFDGLRNAMVGWTAKVGLSYPQWKLLVDGLVKTDD